MLVSNIIMNVWSPRNSSFSGALLWGVWAFFVNFESSVPAAVRSSFVQALLSAGSIYCLTSGMDYFLLNGPKNNWVRKSIAAIVPFLVLLAVIFSTHLIAQTPNLIFTIAPPASIGVVFSIFYVMKRNF